MGLQSSLKELTKDFGKERVSHLNAKRCKKFIEKDPAPHNDVLGIYLKAFMEFCWKKNVYCDDSPWLKRNPINWEMPKFEAGDRCLYV